MKERPILFSAPMVRALLDGSKTQTRRAIRPQPVATVEEMLTWHHPKDDVTACFWGWGGGQIVEDSDRCSAYGKPGDRLWVRESFVIDDYRGKDVPEAERARVPIYYKADPLPCLEGAEGEIRWTPSIHMPRWACRIELEVTGVRVERLQDISEEDARAEGIEPIKSYEGRWKNYMAPPMWDVPLLISACTDPRDSYGSLWESINGEGAWQANPWVWCVSFKRVKP